MLMYSHHIKVMSTYSKEMWDVKEIHSYLNGKFYEIIRYSSGSEQERGNLSVSSGCFEQGKSFVCGAHQDTQILNEKLSLEMAGSTREQRGKLVRPNSYCT